MTQMEPYTASGKRDSVIESTSQQVDLIKAEPATTRYNNLETEVGSVFVSNYPPYSFWSEDALASVHQALQHPSSAEVDLGLYLHIPFCRKRCKFCYYRVYTDKNSKEIEQYLDLLVREVELYAAMPAISGRSLRFVYFGGGTPSYISSKHLQRLVDQLTNCMTWDHAEEVAFECEPGTLTPRKLETIRQVGVTRLSIGVENLNDDILKENGRAHVSTEIYRAMPRIHQLEFNQVNIDLIAGMVGERRETWEETVQKAIDLDPDSITIYQMELPFNTVYSKQIMSEEGLSPYAADWKTKREWNHYAIEELIKAGYERSSAYTMVKKDRPHQFIYRDALWHSSDMIGTGVASFSHLNGIHFQNLTDWKGYLEALQTGTLPLSRAFKISHQEKMTREMILQLKLGQIEIDYFRQKFGIEILDHFSVPYQKLRGEGMLNFDTEKVSLTQKGLLQVDRLLPEFYAEKYQNARYT